MGSSDYVEVPFPVEGPNHTLPDSFPHVTCDPGHSYRFFKEHWPGMRIWFLPVPDHGNPVVHVKSHGVQVTTSGQMQRGLTYGEWDAVPFFGV